MHAQIYVFDKLWLLFIIYLARKTDEAAMHLIQELLGPVLCIYIFSTICYQYLARPMKNEILMLFFEINIWYRSYQDLNMKTKILKIRSTVVELWSLTRTRNGPQKRKLHWYKLVNNEFKISGQTIDHMALVFQLNCNNFTKHHPI